MKITGKQIVVGAGLALTLTLLLKKPAQAAVEYICPYGDKIEFKTLAELQSHVGSSHPGERMPISIQWQ